MTKTTLSRKLAQARELIARHTPPDAPFDLFQPGAVAPITEELVEDTMKEFPDATREVIEAQLVQVASDAIFINSRYQVNIAEHPAAAPGWPDLLQLSIQRRDKERVGPEKYRDFMAIKDRLVGPENEAVELYPARSREYDTANQYHIYVVKDPTVRFPLGFDFGERVASEHSYQGGAKQEPFTEPHHRVAT